MTGAPAIDAGVAWATVGGAVLGALVAGPRNRSTGALLGALVGAAVGTTMYNAGPPPGLLERLPGGV